MTRAPFVSWFHDLSQDAVYGLRMLVQNPGFTAIAAISLALGIGANTAIFSFLNAFTRPLPVPAPEQLVVVAADVKGDDTGLRYRFSYPALQDFQKQADLFSDVFAYGIQVRGLSTGGKSTQFFFSP